MFIKHGDDKDSKILSIIKGITKEEEDLEGLETKSDLIEETIEEDDDEKKVIAEVKNGDE